MKGRTELQLKNRYNGTLKLIQKRVLQKVNTIIKKKKKLAGWFSFFVFILLLWYKKYPLETFEPVSRDLGKKIFYFLKNCFAQKWDWAVWWIKLLKNLENTEEILSWKWIPIWRPFLKLFLHYKNLKNERKVSYFWKEERRPQIK